MAILLHRFASNEPPCEIINKVLSFNHAVADGKHESGHEAGPLLNYTYRTPHYALGGLMFDPAEVVSPISSDRRTQGVIFNNAEKTGVALFPYDGGKPSDSFWHVQYKNVMVGQKYKSWRVNLQQPLYVQRARHRESPNRLREPCERVRLREPVTVSEAERPSPRKAQGKMSLHKNDARPPTHGQPLA